MPQVPKVGLCVMSSCYWCLIWLHNKFGLIPCRFPTTLTIWNKHGEETSYKFRNIIQLPASNHKHKIYGHDKLLCFKQSQLYENKNGEKTHRRQGVHSTCTSLSENMIIIFMHFFHHKKQRVKPLSYRDKIREKLAMLIVKDKGRLLFFSIWNYRLD